MTFPPLKEPLEYRADIVSQALSSDGYDHSHNVFNDPHLKVQTPKGNFRPSHDFPTHPQQVDDDISGMLMKDSKMMGDWRVGMGRPNQWTGEQYFSEFPPPGQRQNGMGGPMEGMGPPGLMAPRPQDKHNMMRQQSQPPHLQQPPVYTMFGASPGQHLGGPAGGCDAMPMVCGGRSTPRSIQQQQSIPYHMPPSPRGTPLHQQQQQPHQQQRRLQQQRIQQPQLQKQQYKPPTQQKPNPQGALPNTGPLGPHDPAHLQECQMKSSSPPTVDWLSNNYQVAEGISLPRSTLYAHYMDHCAKASVEAVNAASFGKIIRQVFPNLKTRRLGTRGNSKYHYYGIRLSPSSSLNGAQARSVEKAGQVETKTASGKVKVEEKTVDLQASPSPADASATETATTQGTAVATATVDRKVRVTLDAFPGDIQVLTSGMSDAGITTQQVNSFQKIYKEHCQLLLDNMLNLEFSTVQDAWVNFWGKDYNPSYTPIFASSEVMQLIENCDRILYDTALSSMLPDVLKVYPMLTAQAIRGFSKSLEEWCEKALDGKPAGLVAQKKRAVKSFSHYLRRYTSLNHLAQAARAVLGSHFQVQSMVSDLSRVDFGSIKEQMEWIAQGSCETLTTWHEDFARLLKSKVSLEEWVKWLSGIVEAEVGNKELASGQHVVRARQFLMEWAFYSSLIIRDLTLRSAQTFGSFHLIRLMFDEYILYKVEKQLAEITVQPLLGSTLGFSRQSKASDAAAAFGEAMAPRVAATAPSDEEASMPGDDEARGTPSSSTTSSTLSLNSVDHDEDRCGVNGSTTATSALVGTGHGAAATISVSVDDVLSTKKRIASVACLESESGSDALQGTKRTKVTESPPRPTLVAV